MFLSFSLYEYRCIDQLYNLNVFCCILAKSWCTTSWTIDRNSGVLFVWFWKIKKWRKQHKNPFLDYSSSWVSDTMISVDLLSPDNFQHCRCVVICSSVFIQTIASSEGMFPSLFIRSQFLTNLFCPYTYPMWCMLISSHVWSAQRKKRRSVHSSPFKLQRFITLLKLFDFEFWHAFCVISTQLWRSVVWLYAELSVWLPCSILFIQRLVSCTRYTSHKRIASNYFC